MISGPAALTAIDEALRDIRREEDEILRRLARTAELLAKLRTQEGELCRQLLSIRLDAADRERLTAEIAAAEAEMFEMLGAHDAALAEAAADLASLDAAIASEGAARTVLQNQAAARDAELRALAAKARPRLGRDPGYGSRAEAAQRRAEAAELSFAKAAEAEAARARNTEPYRSDPLFMYLWERKFGTKDYRGGALTASLDGWVARLVGYEQARARFEMHMDLPQQLALHAEDQAARARAAAHEIAALENRAVDSAGGAEARQALSAIVDKIVASDRRVRELADRRDEAMRTDRGLAEGRDPKFAAKLGALTDLLSRPDVAKIVEDARTAPRAQDPTVTAQLDELTRRALEEDDEVREQRSRLGTLEARRRDLEALAEALRANGFDNPHSSFTDDDLTGDALNVFLHGEIALAGYWERWRLAQRWDAPAGYGGPGGGWGLLSAPVRDNAARSVADTRASRTMFGAA